MFIHKTVGETIGYMMTIQRPSDVSA